MILPKIGGFLTTILTFVFFAIGLLRFHRTTLLKVLLALLIPLFLLLALTGFYITKLALLLGAG